MERNWKVSKTSKVGEYSVTEYYKDKDGKKRDTFTLRICQIEEHTIAEYPLRSGLNNLDKLTHSFVTKKKKSFEFNGLEHFKNNEDSVVVFDNKAMTKAEFVKFTYENKRKKHATDLIRLEK